MHFAKKIAATNVPNTTRKVTGDVYVRVRNLEWARPTSDPSGSGTIARGTSKAKAITHLKTISKGVKNEGTFFRYRFRRKMKATLVRTD